MTPLGDDGRASRRNPFEQDVKSGGPASEASLPLIIRFRLHGWRIFVTSLGAQDESFDVQ